MIILVIAAGVATMPPASETLLTYNLCVRHAAAKLEPSEEAPDVIAEAAKAFCTAERVAALNTSRDFKGSAGSGASIEEIERAATFYGKAQVVASRTCRKGGDCTLANR